MELHFTLIFLGVMLLLGLAADAIGRVVGVPRVTLLMLIGVAIGPSGADLMPEEIAHWREFLATSALTMVAFVLGGRLTGRALGAQGREIVIVSLAVVTASVLGVTAAMLAIGLPAALALIFGAVATATDPAATQDVVRQAGARGRFADRLLGIVAVDDGWGLIAFGLALLGAGALAGGDGWSVAGLAARELGGAVLVGALVGLPAAALTGRLRPGEPMRLEALGVVFLCAGLALWIEASFLLAGMLAGALVANLARHHERPFHEIEHMEWPFLVLFFLLAGASVDLSRLAQLGPVGLAYLLGRLAGRMAGGLAGARLAGMRGGEGAWTGAALTPQAGVAVGMALVAADRFPAWGETILTVTVASTAAFEILGPLLTRLALVRAGRGTGEAEPDPRA